MSELKPCPHCGEANELYPEMRDMGRSGPFAIGCLGCGSDFVPREGRDVVAAWNRRDEAAISQARAEGRREGLEAGAAAATDLAQQWDDGEGSRTFNACMAIHDKLLEMAKEDGK